MTAAPRAFVDTNVILYTVENDEFKAARAYDIMDQGPLVSAQVLNEFVNVARKKLKLGWPAVRDGLEHVTTCCEVLPLTFETHAKAIDFAELHMINIYDACIVATAELSGCTVLYTEDMNHGQRIGGVLIQNPFL